MRGIFVYYALHTGFQFDRKSLTRFAAFVVNDSIPDIFFAQIGHVDKRHAPGIKTK